MLITSIAYQNKQTGWTLQKLSLSRFNLLVGASGVGKTQILRALRTVQQFATKGQILESVAFTIGFQHRDIKYVWEVESAPVEHAAEVSPRSAGPTIAITREKLTSSLDGVLIERTQDNFLFRGEGIPQLNRAETALHLLDDNSITNVADALVDCILDDHPYEGTAPTYSKVEALLEMSRAQDRWHRFVSISTPAKAFLLQNGTPEKFENLKETFKAIFSSVEDVAVEVETSTRPYRTAHESLLEFKIKEHGVQYWVPAADISSGMLRTLIHLVDLTFAPSGSVVLIDEFENSLGVNCMGPLTDFMLSRAAELQFIITSHHPYIINKIPKTHWKVVRRHGSTVKVTPAGEVRALQGSSAQDDFTRLINSPEFEEGTA